MTDTAPVLGRTVHAEDFAGRPPLQTIPVPPDVSVELAVHEGTSVCPATGQPDFWTASISYNADGLGLETKSLKLYLQSYRNEGIFCEHLADRIADDIQQVLDAHGLTVSVRFGIRGGITITAHAVRGKTKEATE